MQTFSITDTGRMRTANQDYIFCQDKEIGSFPNLFIVADGMGGHNAGDTASRMCVEEVVSQIQKSTEITPIGIFEQAVAAANEKVYQTSNEDPAYFGMGTTIVAAMVLGKMVYIVNVGDSRLYVCKETLSQVTVDHSLVEEMVQSGKLQKEEMRTHPNKNIITRALGTNPEVKADCFEIEVEEGDVLLLCSDGLSNMLEDKTIESIIKQNEENMEKAAKQLVDEANAAGGKDNISVVLVRI
ncbi:MAG: Stp1/IreP family PP2C-type Ser/Thr phosphatase [Clostridiales bacterium]|nr:Stp1/IreP family PP2C-type Ser/Thr phosphatase [Eubacterium sp.]MDD5994790.1 Stp1/IreP family PP2C-type Ser/Thr phosphatase [Clostridiales bacterium]MDD7350389.1 Stp1/IreP family PP2C-type Ser/Thr phosphatase [Clostridiales bacterium]MDY3774743.1 Stp1/IreP family PP2C-type Ser/Thr phosphatase [Eubacterium sp.]